VCLVYAMRVLCGKVCGGDKQLESDFTELVDGCLSMLQLEDFGVPQYGGTMVGTVAYPKANQKACKSFDDVDISFKSKPGGLPTFLLADRGGQLFKKKNVFY
jgi:hypothetical protein